MSDRVKKIWEELTAGKSSRFVIAVIMLVGTFLLLGIYSFFEIPERNQTAINILLGIIVTCDILIIKYFFETSKDHSDSKKVDQAKKLSEINESNES